MASLTLEGGNLVYVTSYNPALVDALKAAVPACDRRWDGQRRAWLVTPRYASSLVDLTERMLGMRMANPCVGKTVMVQTEVRILEVRYIGQTKEHGGSERMAFGYVDGEWSVVFPESVLRTWFQNEARPDEVPTLYATLGISRSATEPEIRSAFRRLARQWHPDTCSEPDAAAMFRTIKHAYDVLSDERARQRYDAGLVLQATVGRPGESNSAELGRGYRSPLRCGLIMATGADQLGRFVVSTILAWEDIHDATGRVLSTAWPAGADMFTEIWSEP